MTLLNFTFLSLGFIVGLTVAVLALVAVMRKVTSPEREEGRNLNRESIEQLKRRNDLLERANEIHDSIRILFVKNLED